MKMFNCERKARPTFLDIIFDDESDGDSPKAQKPYLDTLYDPY